MATVPGQRPMTSGGRPASFVFPFVLIVAGALLLLATTGVLPGDAGWRLLDLWPLLLVAVGVQLVVSRLLDGDAARIVALAIVGFLAILAIAYSALGPAITGGTLRHMNTSASATGVTEGRLSIATAGSHVTVVAADTGDQLYRADLGYSGSAPRITSEAGSLEIASPSGVQFGNRLRDDYRITLSSAVPWQLDVSGAGVTGTVDLRATPLSSFNLSGVGGDVVLDVGPASGHVQINVSGVGSSVVVRVPAGSDYYVSASGLGTTSGSRSATPGWYSAADRYDISVSGVGSKVNVEERS